MRTELGLDGHTLGVGLIARLDPQKATGPFLPPQKSWRHAIHTPALSSWVEVPISLHLRVASSLLAKDTDVPRLLRGLDMVVVSSAYGEGFPNILAEAMATEVPCITTDVGDAAALLEDCGAVVAPRDPEALARAISALLVENSGARAVRGRRARKLVRKKYSMAKMLNSYRQLWEFASGANGADGYQPVSPNISIGNGPAMDGWGAAELAQITGGRWI